MPVILSCLKVAYGTRALPLKALIVALLPMTAAAAPVTVLALGDSLTQGYGLPVEDGFVPTLERWLTEQGADVAVLNAGVSGDTTAGGLSRIDWSLTDEVDAVIVALGGNDLLRGIQPDVARANLDGILSRVAERGLPALLIGMAAPGNYGPEYKAAFDAIYPDLAAEYGALYVPSFFAGMTEDAAANLGGLMQPDGIHPNAEGVARIVGALGPVVLDLVRDAGG